MWEWEWQKIWLINIRTRSTSITTSKSSCLYCKTGYLAKNSRLCTTNYVVSMETEGQWNIFPGLLRVRFARVGFSRTCHAVWVYWYPVSSQRRLNVVTTLFGRHQRCYNVENDVVCLLGSILKMQYKLVLLGTCFSFSVIASLSITSRVAIKVSVWTYKECQNVII